MKTNLHFPLLKLALVFWVILISCSCNTSKSNACNTNKIFRAVENMESSKNSIEKEEIESTRNQLDDLSKCPDLKQIDHVQIDEYYKSLNLLMAKVNSFQMHIDSTNINIEKQKFSSAAIFLDKAKACFPESNRVVSLANKLSAQQKLQASKGDTQFSNESDRKEDSKKLERSIREDWVEPTDWDQNNN